MQASDALFTDKNDLQESATNLRIVLLYQTFMFPPSIIPTVLALRGIRLILRDLLFTNPCFILLVPGLLTNSSLNNVFQYVSRLQSEIGTDS